MHHRCSTAKQSSATVRRTGGDRPKRLCLYIVPSLENFHKPLRIVCLADVCKPLEGFAAGKALDVIRADRSTACGVRAANIREARTCSARQTQDTPKGFYKRRGSFWFHVGFTTLTP